MPFAENTPFGQVFDFETNERLQDICSQQKFQEVVGIFPTFLPFVKYSECHVPENTSHIDWWNRDGPSTDKTKGKIELLLRTMCIFDSRVA